MSLSSRPDQPTPSLRSDLHPLRFIGGARFPVKAVFFIIGHPSVWLWCLAPLLINIIVAVVVWRYSGDWTSQIQDVYANATQWWARLIHWGAAGLAFILRLMITAFALIVVGNISAVPFNDALSERVDRIVTGYRNDAPFQLGPEIRRQLLILLQEIKRMLIYFTLMAILFVLSFSGALAPFAIPTQWFLTMSYLSIDHLSYPLERRGAVLLKNKVAFLRTNAAPCLGFGGVMLLIALIPLVNFVFLPLGVVGGTLLFADIIRRRDGVLGQ